MAIHRYTAIEGVIGVGKTTLARRLGEVQRALRDLAAALEMEPGAFREEPQA